MKLKIIILLFFIFSCFNAQTKFKVEEKETETWRSIYSLFDENNTTLKVLDSAKYIHFMSGYEYGYFAICQKKEAQVGVQLTQMKKYYSKFIIQVLENQVQII